MSSGKLIKQRLKATKNIFKITHTMELVATAKLKGATRNFNNFSLYRKHVNEILAKVAGSQLQHSLLQPREPAQNIILVGLASNKGLCGNYNTKITDFILETKKRLEKEGKKVALHIVGNKIIRNFQYRNIPIDVAHHNLRDQPKFEEIEPFAKQIIGAFLNDQAQEVWFAYYRKARLVCEKLLPFCISLPKESNEIQNEDYLFDPNPKQLLELLVPMIVRLTLYQIFLEAAISEQTSRMLAMKTASENADKIIKQLTREYNRARQSQITKEILEVLAGAERK